MGGSVGSLREKLALLRSEKDWIPAKNIADIKKYNAEIHKLEKQITKLDTIQGNTFKKNMKNAISDLPFSNLITNPVVMAGAGIAYAGKMALNFEEGMAKINTTAQLTQPELEALKNKLINIGTETGADLNTVPDAFEKILSQTGDVALSQDILKAALMGAKAGFTDQGVVASALAQTLSVVGKENTNAQEVLDTLFAAKRVGAGEFKDFANYVPGLVASGKALGVGFKEAAGLFAFMTSKGQSAEASATLIQNAFTAMGKSEITSGMEKAGIGVFNKDGSMKDMDVIFGSLQKKLDAFGNDDKSKSAFLEKIGLRDAQAKQAFMILASDGNALTKTLKEVANSSGETDSAFRNSMNPMQKMQFMWSQIQGAIIKFGGVLISILYPVFQALSMVLTPVISAISWFFGALSAGNPLVWGAVAAIGAYVLIANGAAIITGIVSGATAIWTGAQWLLNMALMMNPIGLIIIAIIALIAIIAYIAMTTEGWGQTWDNLMKTMKLGLDIFLNGFQMGWLIFKDAFLTGLEVIEKGWYKLKGLWDEEGANAGLAKMQEERDARAKEIAASKEKVAGMAKEMKEIEIWQVKSNGKSFGDVKNDIKKKIGITDPKTAGAGGGLGAGGTGKASTEAIATGGQRNTNINITFKQLVENIVYQGGSGENKDEFIRDIAQQLFQVLNMAQSSVS